MEKKIIIIADDEGHVRSLVKRLLNQNYAVFEAKDGEAAVELARQLKPDIVLMDIMMPKMDGYTACSIIKAEPATTEIPVVILSAGSIPEDNPRLREAGCAGLILKPFAAEDFLKTVTSFLY